jgi:NADH-quinone oxidoreductase subunit J
MLLGTLIFWVIFVMTAASAVVVVAARNILHAAFSLCLTFLGVAALYIFLHADFVAAVQVIIYVGGILVLIMFAVMFSSSVVEDAAEGGRSRLALVVGGIVAAALFAALVVLIQRLAVPLEAANPAAAESIQTTIVAGQGQESLGQALMGRYLLPFELVSVVLLAALVGAVVIVRKELR